MDIAKRGGECWRVSRSGSWRIDSNLAEGFWLFKTAFDFFNDMDPSMIQALKLNQSVEEGLVPHGNIFREMKGKKDQNYDVLCKVTLSVPASPSTSATPETARLLLVLLSLFNKKMTRMKTFMMVPLRVKSPHATDNKFTLCRFVSVQKSKNCTARTVSAAASPMYSVCRTLCMRLDGHG